MRSSVSVNGGNQNPHLISLFSNPAIGARARDLSAGEAIVQPTQPATSVFLVKRGQVRTFLPGPENETRLLEILGPDQWIGVASIAHATTWGISAVAATPVTVVEVPVDRFLEAVSHSPEASLELARSLAARMESARQDAAKLVFNDCNSRLVDALVRFSESAAATPTANGVTLRITHQQLAQAIGVARETVSLALTQLRHRGLVQTGRNQLSYNPGALAREAKLEPAACG